MAQSKAVLELARRIDAARARELQGEFSQQPLVVLLATAYPALTPMTRWQREALQRTFAEGFRAMRNRGDYMARLLAAVDDFADVDALRDNLRRVVWAERARIALRELLPAELGGAPFFDAARELSELAEVSLEVALSEAHTHTAARFSLPRRADGQPSVLVALGMGKLGGYELNAGSDIDLCFVYDTDEGGSDISLHEHWSRVVRRAVQTLEEPRAEGFVWRVDLRLRPEGSRGPLVNSLAATERYYETWGRLWERAAMIRARAIAGDQSLGEELEHSIVHPFVYRRAVNPAVATTMAELLSRSRAELSKNPERDLKLGVGGIREAEFFVQALQLIWGGKEASVRVPSALGALARLRSRGLVTDREVGEWSSAYTLLRRAEHAVQWATGIQTHDLPEAADQRARLAHVLGFAELETFERELSERRARVHELFQAVLPEAPRPPARHRVFLRHLDAEPSQLDAQSLELFGNAEVGEHLVALSQRPDGLLGELTEERFPELPDDLVDAVAQCPDPALAARTLRAFFSRFSSVAPYVNALTVDPLALRRFITVLGSSAFVGDAVVSRPDLADVLLFGPNVAPDAAQVVDVEVTELTRTLAPDADAYDRRDALLHGLRRAKRRVTVEVAVADLAGSIDTRDATRLLSALADRELALAVEFEASAGDCGLAVIAVGKLGGCEIGYGSDLDVLFVFDPERAPPDKDPQEHFVRAAQRVIRLISEPHPAGPGYELDTRLRPSGSHGMLVTSLSAFARYHGLSLNQEAPAVQASGAPWERQALIRARPCAGDADLGRRFLALAQQAAYERGAPPVAELHRLRMRMERELAQEREGRFDLKLGHGGLADVEFATQWLQMQHGLDPRVRTTDTLQGLEALAAAGYLERPAYETFREAYEFLRRLEQRIHVLRGTSATVIDAGSAGLHELARRMGLTGSGDIAPREELLQRYRDTTRSVRETYLRVLGVGDAS
ncbi:MAG: bifunctional [glutamate--ammonia ligase]-adenylyl-L-tyrosine phosphorylase/[glutamate--ammonia-ligase] adenylyltransferase [Polyangiaceae bacterium]